MKDKKLGVLGLGTMHFCIVSGLIRSGFKAILPTYRREIDASTGFSQLAPDAETKNRLYDELLALGCEPSENQVDLIRRCDILLIMMPNSRFVEMLMYGDDGIIANMRPGTVVIDFSSSDGASTRKLAAELEKRGVEMLDAPVSGGNTGAAAQTLSVMVGGKKEVYEQCLPIFHTMGNPDKVVHVGPSGAGDIIKCCNNFLSCCCIQATTEAISVAAQNGIDPHVAASVISSSGGRNDASMNKFPNLVFPGKLFHGTIGMMLKDMALFTQAAKDGQVTTFLGNTTYQFWNACVNEFGPQGDMSEVVKLYEKWNNLKLFGIDQ